jgi:adenosylcobinamide-GDP ribazoletransferase
MKRILLAITFLTRLPLPAPKKVAPEDIGESTPFFPIVGLILGGILVGINYFCSYFWDPLVTNIAIVVSLIAFTGGLHLDGLMDTCDGIFSNKNRERTLEIMRDSRVGSMGVLAGICLLLLKIFFLNSIAQDMKIPVLLAFPVLGRWSMVYAVSLYPYARSTSGLGALFVEYAKHYYVLVATIIVLIITIPLLLWKAFPVFIVIGFATWMMSRRLSKRLGGLTGDTYGAICETMETLSLAVLSMKFINS